MNVTLGGLVLSQHFRNSPFLTTSRITYLEMQRSKFSKFFSPILYGKTPGQTHLNNIAFTSGLATAISLNSRATFEKMNYSAQEEPSSLFITGNQYENCVINAPIGSLMNVSATLVWLSGCTFLHCIISGIGSTSTGSLGHFTGNQICLLNTQIDNCTCEDPNPAFSFNNFNEFAQFEFSNINSYQDQNNISLPLLHAQTGNLLTIRNNTIKFKEIDSSLFSINDVMTTEFNTVFFYHEEDMDESASIIELSKASQALIKYCLFSNISQSSFVKTDDTSNYIVITGNCFYDPNANYSVLQNTVQNGKVYETNYLQIVSQCYNDPQYYGRTKLPSETLSDLENIYQYVTIVWFLLFFVLIFVSLVSCIICKHNTQQQQYGDDEEEESEEEDSF